MKITKKILEKIINEELANILKEEDPGAMGRLDWEDTSREPPEPTMAGGGSMSARDVVRNMPLDRLVRSVINLYVDVYGPSDGTAKTIQRGALSPIAGLDRDSGKRLSPAEHRIRLEESLIDLRQSAQRSGGKFTGGGGAYNMDIATTAGGARTLD